jgi:hypothetical protein
MIGVERVADASEVEGKGNGSSIDHLEIEAY